MTDRIVIQSDDWHEEPPPGVCDVCGRDDVDLCPHCFICPVCVCFCQTPAPLCAVCSSPAKRCAVCCQCHRCGCDAVAHGFDRDDGAPDRDDPAPWES